MPEMTEGDKLRRLEEEMEGLKGDVALVILILRGRFGEAQEAFPVEEKEKAAEEDAAKEV